MMVLPLDPLLRRSLAPCIAMAAFCWSCIFWSSFFMARFLAIA
jgi:hypothetical protein